MTARKSATSTTTRTQARKPRVSCVICGKSATKASPLVEGHQGLLHQRCEDELDTACETAAGDAIAARDAAVAEAMAAEIEKITAEIAAAAQPAEAEVAVAVAVAADETTQAKAAAVTAKPRAPRGLTVEQKLAKAVAAAREAAPEVVLAKSGAILVSRVTDGLYISVDGRWAFTCLADGSKQWSAAAVLDETGTDGAPLLGEATTYPTARAALAAVGKSLARA